MQQQLTCQNCGHHFTDKYCNHCGEKAYTEKDRSIVHFFEEGLHFVTHFEGTFFTTIKTMFTKPGQLSLDYCNGKRKKYFKPLSFFLLLIVIYLLFPVFGGLNMKAAFYTQQPYGGYAIRKIHQIMTERTLTPDQFEALFHHKSEKTSKFVLLVIIPFTALFFWILTFKKRKYFFDQMVFSAEVNSVFLLWGFLLLPLLTGLYYLLLGPTGDDDDLILSIIAAVPLCVYVAFASRRFYSINRWQSIALALLFAFANFIIVQVIYKLILFMIVINTI